MYRGNWLNYIPYVAEKRAAFRGKAMKITKRGGFGKLFPVEKSNRRPEGAPLRKSRDQAKSLKPRPRRNLTASSLVTRSMHSGSSRSADSWVESIVRRPLAKSTEGISGRKL